MFLELFEFEDLVDWRVGGAFSSVLSNSQEGLGQKTLQFPLCAQVSSSVAENRIFSIGNFELLMSFFLKLPA